ncbi:MAG: hypothetical protein KC912_05505 [Proteobacteria bacterium]|nr:hypothetical protein [Pseudomonadota bacterium]
MKRIPFTLLSLCLLGGVALAQSPRAERAQEREAEVLEWVAEQDATKHAKLMRLESADPERYRMALRRAGKMMHLMEVDPTAMDRRARMKEVRSELQDLSGDFDELSKRDQKERRADVEALVEEGYELRLESAEAQIALQEARLAKARERLEEARSERDERVEKHVQKVLSGELPERGERL